MPRVWRFLPFDAAQVRALCGMLLISPLLVEGVSARGYVCHGQA